MNSTFTDNRMAPSAIDQSAQASEPQNIVPPPKLYTPREIHFEKYLDSQPDGYQKAVSRGPERAAIVIDNGNSPSLPKPPLILKSHNLTQYHRLLSNSSRLVLRRCAPPKPHTHFLKIPRQEDGQNLFFRGR